MAFVPGTTQQQNADHHHRGMYDNSDAIYNDSLLSMNHVCNRLNNNVYFQVLEYAMDTAVAVMRDIVLYKCIDRHDVP